MLFALLPYFLAISNHNLRIYNFSVFSVKKNTLKYRAFYSSISFLADAAIMFAVPSIPRVEEFIAIS